MNILIYIHNDDYTTVIYLKYAWFWILQYLYILHEYLPTFYRWSTPILTNDSWIHVWFSLYTCNYSIQRGRNTGHLYPNMLDYQTDLSKSTSFFSIPSCLFFCILPIATSFAHQIWVLLLALEHAYADCGLFLFFLHWLLIDVLRSRFAPQCVNRW